MEVSAQVMGARGGSQELGSRIEKQDSNTMRHEVKVRLEIS